VKLNEGDFVKLNYTGYLKSNNFCIDTTIEEIAKKQNIFSKEFKYGPVTVCIGKNNILNGIDKNLSDKDEKESFELELEPKEAFGEKNNNLASVPFNQFKANKVNVQIGDQIMYNEKPAFVKFVNNRIVMLDFNHPYAGEIINYKIELLGKVEDKKNQFIALVINRLNFNEEMFSVELNDNIINFTINEKELPKQFQDEFEKYVKESIEIEKINYSFKK
jgi:FKBP-type peptidyl-prolyl cis-trans isomerase 2